MDIHVRNLGTLNIVFGVFSVLVSIALLATYGTPVTMYSSMSGNSISAALLIISAGFHMLLAIPCIAGGIYLRSYVEWSRSVITVTSALNLLNVPFGSVLGCYGLWVLLTPETDPLFSEPPRSRDIPKPVPAASQSDETAPSAETKTVPPRIVPSPRS
jgi:hypothetical protein